MTISRKHLNDLAHLTALIEVMADDKKISKSEMADVIKTMVLKFSRNHCNTFNKYKWDDYVRNENETIKRVMIGITTPIKLVHKKVKGTNENEEAIKNFLEE